jgi:hypothetical protein
MDVPDMDALMAAMETPEAAEAMAHVEIERLADPARGES